MDSQLVTFPVGVEFGCTKPEVSAEKKMKKDNQHLRYDPPAIASLSCVQTFDLGKNMGKTLCHVARSILLCLHRTLPDLDLVWILVVFDMSTPIDLMS